MRRLLQFGFVVLVLAAFLTPLSEYFDRWDTPGIGNDTEMGLFCLVLLICLVLVVSKLVAWVARSVSLSRIPWARWGLVDALRDRTVVEAIFIPPQFPTLLRI